MIGIYILRSKKENDDRVYIGSSSNIAKRKWTHFSTLKESRHQNRFVQNVYDKYGLEHEVLEECKKEELIEREQYYYDMYSKTHTLMNKMRPIDNPMSNSISREKSRQAVIKRLKDPVYKERQLKQMREAQKLATKATMKRIQLINLGNGEVLEFDAVTRAIEYLMDYFGSKKNTVKKGLYDALKRPDSTYKKFKLTYL